VIEPLAGAAPLHGGGAIKACMMKDK
jgi:hypothetical protein